MLLYDLCKTFKCLPGQLDEEDPVQISKLMVVHSAMNRVQAEKIKEAERKAKK